MATKRPPLRFYDEKRNRLITASPNVFMVWQGEKPGRAIAGPHMLPKPPQTEDELREAYQEWIEAGEPE